VPWVTTHTGTSSSEWCRQQSWVEKQVIVTFPLAESSKTEAKGVAVCPIMRGTAFTASGVRVFLQMRAAMQGKHAVHVNSASMSSDLTAVEDWLYEFGDVLGEQARIDQYMAKLEALKVLTEPSRAHIHARTRTHTHTHGILQPNHITTVCDCFLHIFI
jgi:hypothetical protein